MQSKTAYRKFCNQLPDLPVFAMGWYLDSTCGEKHWDVVVDEIDGEVVAAWPYFIKQKKMFQYIAMPPFTKFMGPFLLPAFQQNTAKEIIPRMLAALPPVSYFSQNFFYTINPDETLPITDFEPKRFYSYQLNGIGDLDHIYARFARYYRNSILPKASQNLSVRHDLGFEAYYEINEKTYQRQGLKLPFSAADFRRNWDAILANNAGLPFFVTDEQNRLHAAALLVWDKKIAYYHSAGNDPEFRKSGAGIFLVWEMIRYAAKELQLDTFDFAGSMIPAIEKIWKNFGAERKYYYHIEHYYSSWFKLAKGTQQLIKKYSHNQSES